MPWALTLFAVFSLGFAVWNYWLGYQRFSLVLTVAGAVPVVLLIMLQAGGRKIFSFVQATFTTLIVAMLYVFLLLCDVQQTGLIGAICMVPGLVAVCGFRLAGWLLLINFPVLTALLAGLLPWQVDTYSREMWVVFLGAYVGLGIFVVVVDFNRDRSRQQLVDMVRKFDHVASLDQLTGLPNRREMERSLGGAMNGYHLAGEVFSIVVADVDDYKDFNGRFGRQFGDKLLKAVSKALQRGLRSDDMLARWGGDEFLVLLRGQKIEAAQQVAERLRRNVSNLKLTSSDQEIEVTMSFGVTCVEGCETIDELIGAADRGLFQAKNMGRDMVVAG